MSSRITLLFVGRNGHAPKEPTQHVAVVKIPNVEDASSSLSKCTDTHVFVVCDSASTARDLAAQPLFRTQCIGYISKDARDVGRGMQHYPLPSHVLASWTTLVEAILSGHKQFRAACQLPTMIDMLHREIQKKKLTAVQIGQKLVDDTVRGELRLPQVPTLVYTKTKVGTGTPERDVGVLDFVNGKNAKGLREAAIEMSTKWSGIKLFVVVATNPTLFPDSPFPIVRVSEFKQPSLGNEVLAFLRTLDKQSRVPSDLAANTLPETIVQYATELGTAQEIDKLV